MLHNTSSFDILIDQCIDSKSLDEHLSKHYLVAILTKLKSMGYVNIPSREAMRYIIAWWQPRAHLICNVFLQISEVSNFYPLLLTLLVSHAVSDNTLPTGGIEFEGSQMEQWLLSYTRTDCMQINLCIAHYQSVIVDLSFSDQKICCQQDCTHWHRSFTLCVVMKIPWIWYCKIHIWFFVSQYIYRVYICVHKMYSW